MTRIRLAEDLALPLDAATNTFLLFGKRGSGKTNTAVRFAEQLHHADVPFIAVDPVDVWYGVKSNRAGTGPGLANVYVFGGQHADLPLEPTAGALLADTVVDHRISAVLSIKHLSGRDRGRLVGDFAKRLFQRNTLPVHLFLEEAHEVAPQQPMSGEEEMLGHINRLVKLGRSSGIGVTAITQRPASLNKNITTQAEILVVHRLLGPQDVEAVRQWIKYHGDNEGILGQLATLSLGDAFLWAPDFPESKPIGLKRVHFLHRETFDSSATPKAGEKRVEPKALAPVDVDKLRAKLAATIERAKAEDPKELRKRIAELERTTKQKAAAAPATVKEKVVEKRVEVAVLKEGQLARLEKVVERWSTAGEQVVTVGRELAQVLARLHRSSNGHAPQPAPARAVPISRPEPRAQARPRRTEPSESLSRPQQKLLDALAWLESINTRPAKRSSVAFVAEVSSKSSGFEKNVSTLSTLGLIRYPTGGMIELTDDGRAIANPPDDAPTTEALQDAVLRRLSRPQAELLRQLIAVYPESLPRAELGDRAGQSDTSSGFEKNVSTLRTLGLVEYPEQGSVAAQSVLFLET